MSKLTNEYIINRLKSLTTQVVAMQCEIEGLTYELGEPNPHEQNEYSVTMTQEAKLMLCAEYVKRRLYNIPWGKMPSSYKLNSELAKRQILGYSAIMRMVTGWHRFNKDSFKASFYLPKALDRLVKDGFLLYVTSSFLTQLGLSGKCYVLASNEWLDYISHTKTKPK